jgi:outer membrane lipoprotein-sorting protein
MKKIVLILCLCVAAVFLSGCIGQSADTKFTDTDEVLDYAAFLELLEANGFSFEETDEYRGFLSVPQRVVLIGDEQLTIYEFGSNEAMEMAAEIIGTDLESLGYQLSDDGEYVFVDDDQDFGELTM